MPKEITHWLIAAETARSIEGSALGAAVSAFPNCFKLGVILPDVLFFAAWYRNGGIYVDLADEYHGVHGEDTFILLRNLAEIPRDDPHARQMQAIWAGVVSHIYADIVFHPLVFYLTGNYHDSDPVARTRAVQSHRRFEALMDFRFGERSGGAKGHSLRAILAGLEIPRPRLFERLPHCNGAGAELPGMSGALEFSLWEYQLLQAMNKCLFLGGALHFTDGLLPDVANEIAATFQAPQMRSFFPALDAEIPYRNPVTGDATASSIDDLFHEAVRRGAAFCLKMERAVLESDPDLIAERGPSLCYGLEGVSADRGRFFAPRPFC